MMKHDPKVLGLNNRDQSISQYHCVTPWRDFSVKDSNTSVFD